MDLHSAINGALVLDAATGGHHHSPSDGVNGIGHESSSDGDPPSKEEGHGHIGVISEKHGLQCVEETEVHATVDEDTNGGDGESSVQALDAVRLEGLGVDVDQAIELPLASLALSVIGQSSSGVVKGVDEEERHGTSSPTGGDVGTEFGAVAGGLGDSEGGLNGVLESEVQGLGGEVPEHISQVSSPEGIDASTLGYIVLNNKKQASRHFWSYSQVCHRINLWYKENKRRQEKMRLAAEEKGVSVTDTSS